MLKLWAKKVRNLEFHLILLCEMASFGSKAQRRLLLLVLSSRFRMWNVAVLTAIRFALYAYFTVIDHNWLIQVKGFGALQAEIRTPCKSIRLIYWLCDFHTSLLQTLKY